MTVLVAGTALHLLDRARRSETEAATELDHRFGPERKAFRQHKDEELRGELSPLGRIDYLHLDAGESRVGPDAAAQVRLPAEAMAPYVGDLRLVAPPGAGRLIMRAHPGVPVNGKPSTEGDLKNGDVIAVGRVRLLVAALPALPELAVYDLEAAPRRAYQGLRYYPDDSRYVALAHLERHPAPRTVTVEASRGGPQKMQAIGLLHFEIAGTPCSMEAFGEAGDPALLFLIFKDQTNGQPDGSYGAGRFLYARVWPGDAVPLDFNQAWNPLCAYSHYFHCPLPPRSNNLPVALPVGEKAYAAH